MEAVFDRHSLYEAVHSVSGALAARAPRPALQCLHFEARGGRVAISATDLRIAIRRVIEVRKLTREGTVLIHGTRLGALLREVTDEEVKIRADGGTAVLTAGRSVFRLVVQEPAEYPALPQFGKADIVVASDVLDTLIRRTAFAAAQEQGRYAIDGVSIVVDGGRIELAATDGRRLAVAVAEGQGKRKMERCIVPPRMLAEVRRLSGEGDEVELALAGGQILARVGDGVVAGSLVEGTFPAYADMIPPKGEKVFRVKAQVLASRLRQAVQVTTEESRAVTLELAPGRIRIEARSSGIGEASIEMDAEYEADPMGLSLNPQFLLDVLPEFGDEEIAVEVESPKKPVVVRREGFVYVVAPVKVRT